MTTSAFTEHLPVDTVFVVGAGASLEAGLPLGSQLKDSIAHLLDIQFVGRASQTHGDRVISEAYEFAANEVGEQFDNYQRAGWRIKRAMPLALSIDNYLDHHKGDAMVEFVGKLGITRAILMAENASKLALSDQDQKEPNFLGLGGSWYVRLIKALTENCRVQDMEQRLKSVAFVVFNYDRCLEHFLYHAISTYCHVEPSESAALLRLLRVYHPYGVVGRLPWTVPDGHAGVSFGVDLGSRRLIDVARGIKTFTESTNEDDSDINSIRHVMRTARRIVFLGFAFHPMNMDVLFPRGPEITRREGTSVYGTAYGISNSDKQIIVGNLFERSGISTGDMRIENLTCSGLFDEEWRSLSLAR